MEKRSTKRRPVVILIVALAIVGACFLCLYVVANQAYDSRFVRQEPSEPSARSVDEFPGLTVERCSFASDKGQMLAGYLYSKAGTQPKGVVVLAHGFGFGGQCTYMDVADYFTSNGYLVFAYDATGFGESEGNSTVGTQQGIIDLDHALDYVEANGETKDYPIVLWGHSWGAYCASCALADHPEVKAIVALSGYNSSTDEIDSFLTGNLEEMFIPVAGLIEQQRFGSYASYTSLAGFASTNAGVMIVQSADDPQVSESIGYDLYYEKYLDDSRFTFRLYQDRQHLYIYHTDAAREYATSYDEEESAYFDERDIDRPSAEESAAYVAAHPFDKKVGYAIDLELMDQMRDFYDRYCS